VSAGAREDRRPVFVRRGDRAALRVSEHDHRPCAEACARQLDAANPRGHDDVAGDTDDEEVTEALVEDQLRANAEFRRHRRLITAVP
jgi:hypothetical protein